MGGLSGHFWVIWSGTLINRTATFVCPFLVLYLTGSEHQSLTTAGAVVSVAGFGSLVSQPVGGFLADRYGRRWTLAGGMMGTAAAELLLGYAPSLALTFGAAALLGILLDLYRPAVQAMVADLSLPRTGRAPTASSSGPSTSASRSPWWSAGCSPSAASSGSSGQTP